MGAAGLGGPMNATMTLGFGDGLPKEPERYTLRGHKSRVTKVALHPVYADVASSSEDGTIKVWDFESGEL
jgi:platelet-activating factor acetylhydrolase IB subunit alpha